MDRVFEEKMEIKKRKKQLCTQIRGVVDDLVELKIKLKKQIMDEDIDCDKAIICFETQREMEDVKIQFNNINPHEMTPYFYSQATKVELGTSARPGAIIW